MPARSAKVSTTSSSAATAQTAAADAAYRVAVHATVRRGALRGEEGRQPEQPDRGGRREGADARHQRHAPAHQHPGIGQLEGRRRTGDPGGDERPEQAGGHRETEGAREAGCALDRRALGGGHAHQRRYCGGMSLHPPAPSDLNGLVDAYAQTVQSVIDLGRTMRPDDAARPTDCPGWTVLDQIAHVASAEAMVAGRARARGRRQPPRRTCGTRSAS